MPYPRGYNKWIYTNHSTTSSVYHSSTFPFLFIYFLSFFLPFFSPLLILPQAKVGRRRSVCCCSCCYCCCWRCCTTRGQQRRHYYYYYCQGICSISRCFFFSLWFFLFFLCSSARWPVGVFPVGHFHWSLQQQVRMAKRRLVRNYYAAISVLRSADLTGYLFEP